MKKTGILETEHVRLPHNHPLRVERREVLDRIEKRAVKPAVPTVSGMLKFWVREQGRCVLAVPYHSKTLGFLLQLAEIAKAMTHGLKDADIRFEPDMQPGRPVRLLVIWDCAAMPEGFTEVGSMSSIYSIF